MRRIASVYGGPVGEEEDLYQEIVLQAWKSLPSFRGDAAAGTWLYRLALNTALTWRRRVTRRMDVNASLEGGADRSGGAIGSSSVVSARSESEILHEFLGRLDGVNRSVLILYMEGLSHAQIAEVTGVTANAVGVRIHRMKQEFTARYLEGES